MFLPTEEELRSLPEPTPESPLRILLSGCLSGRQCGYDGSSYGEWRLLQKLASLPNIKCFSFCPEEFSFGTPRELCDIHGGNGFDVLDGKARVLTESGQDWTAPMIRAAERMLELARESRIHVAILMDISAACGSQVIYDGSRTRSDKRYQKGPGVCAALLLRNGFKVISQRDWRTLELLLRKLDPEHVIDTTAVDHHETAWYREYFGQKS